jgi:hypothetical protein
MLTQINKMLIKIVTRQDRGLPEDLPAEATSRSPSFELLLPLYTWYHIPTNNHIIPSFRSTEVLSYINACTRKK